jgi:ribosomal protein S27E
VSEKWNTCPKCKNEVDVDDVFDGSEVRCLGCRTVLVVVCGGEYVVIARSYECEGDVWRLDVQDDDVQDDEEAEKIFDMDSTPDPLAAESAEPAR